MADNTSQEKTEAASPRKRQEARKKGQVPKSREVSSVAVLMGGLGALYFSGSWMFAGMTEFMSQTFLGLKPQSMSPAAATRLMLDLFLWGTRILFPVLLTVAVVALAANLLQVGFLFTTESLVPKFSRMDPFKGIKRMFSLRSLNELGKSILKLTIVGGVGFAVVFYELDGIPPMVDMSAFQIFGYMMEMGIKTAFYTALALILIAVLDFSFQRWQHEKDLRMTKQEVKDEHKQTEGDPIVKSRIRRVQMEMAKRRMMQDVPLADVVVTNPTHLAVALRYQPREMTAPRVLAKGAGHVARRIREIAEEHDIPIVENKPLAQALFKGTEVGESIPVELYHAVAETLAYVYKLKGKTP